MRLLPALLLALSPLVSLAADKLEVGDKAPTKLPSSWIKGERVSTLDPKKTYVIEFWSTWCPPCVEEMPMFSDVQTAYKDKNVVFVGIAADQADNVKKFLKNTPVNYPIAIGGQPGFDLSREMGNRHDAVPFTLIINPQESISTRHFGIYTRKDLESDLNKALK